MTSIEQISAFLDQLLEDTSVPKNVRAAIGRAKEKLLNSVDDGTGVSAAIYSLDEVSNDINLPMHARTMIWNILSELELLKNEEINNNGE